MATGVWLCTTTELDICLQWVDGSLLHDGWWHRASEFDGASFLSYYHLLKKENVPFYERLASFMRRFFKKNFPRSNTVMLSPYTSMHLEHTQERDQTCWRRNKKKRRSWACSRAQCIKIQNQADPAGYVAKKLKHHLRACVARRIGGHDTTTVFSFLFSYYYAPWQVVRVTFLWNKLRTRVHVAVLASHGMMDPVCSETARPYISPSPMHGTLCERCLPRLLAARASLQGQVTSCSRAHPRNCNRGGGTVTLLRPATLMLHDVLCKQRQHLYCILIKILNSISSKFLQEFSISMA